MNQELSMSLNLLVAALQKPASEFTKADIISYIKENDIRMVNFMYPAADGRLKTLNFVINNEAYLDAILTCGERVDGSSLFPFIEAGSSDLYVLPRFRTAFIDPFSELPTLSMLCSYFNKDGEPLESSPEYTLRKACRAFTDVTGMEFQAMGELEYYVNSENTGLFPATDQRGYHESAPYAKFNDFRTECMSYIAQAGGQIKYGHSEVGNFTLGDKVYEQNEIEFLPVRADLAADQLMIAKWVIRNLAYQYGYDITFAPKITAGKAGSGLHIHMQPRDDAGGCFHHRLRQYEPHLLFPPRAPSGGTDQHLLGRPQPLRPGARPLGLGGKVGHVHAGQSAGGSEPLRHDTEADGGDALAGRVGRPVPVDSRTGRSLPPRFRDGRRTGRGREDVRECEYS